MPRHPLIAFPAGCCASCGARRGAARLRCWTPPPAALRCRSLRRRRVGVSAHSVHFATDRADLLRQRRPICARSSAACRADRRWPRAIVGHADSGAADVHDLGLAARRSPQRSPICSAPAPRGRPIAGRRPCRGRPAALARPPARDRSVEILVDGTEVVLPGCPDWSRDPGYDPRNLPLSNLGCANAFNLGLMVADPGDLATGRRSHRPMATREAEAVVRYRTDKVKPLEAEISSDQDACATGEPRRRREQRQFRAFVQDDATRKVVDQVVSELAIPSASVHKGGIREAIAMLGEQRSPRLLVVDLSGVDLPLSAVNELAEVCEPGVTVIAIGDRNDVGLFRDLINNGVSDYLVKPITPALLQKSLLNVVESADQGAPERPARPAGRRRRRTRRRRRDHARHRHRLDASPTGAAAGSRWSISTCSSARSRWRSTWSRRRACARRSSSPGRIDALFVDRAMVRHSDTLLRAQRRGIAGRAGRARHVRARHPAQGAAQQVPLCHRRPAATGLARRRSICCSTRPTWSWLPTCRWPACATPCGSWRLLPTDQRRLPADHRRQPRRRAPRRRDRRARNSRRRSAAPIDFMIPFDAQVGRRGHQCRPAGSRWPRQGGAGDPAGHRACRRQSRAGSPDAVPALAAPPAMSMFGRSRIGPLPQTRSRRAASSIRRRRSRERPGRSQRRPAPIGAPSPLGPPREALQSYTRTDPGGALRPHRRHGRDQAAARRTQSPDSGADRRVVSRAAAVPARPRAGTAGRHHRRQHGRPRAAGAAAARRNDHRHHGQRLATRSMSSVAASSSSPTSASATISTS